MNLIEKSNYRRYFSFKRLKREFGIFFFREQASCPAKKEKKKKKEEKSETDVNKQKKLSNKESQR